MDTSYVGRELWIIELFCCQRIQYAAEFLQITGLPTVAQADDVVAAQPANTNAAQTNITVSTTLKDGGKKKVPRKRCYKKAKQSSPAGQKRCEWSLCSMDSILIWNISQLKIVCENSQMCVSARDIISIVMFTYMYSFILGRPQTGILRRKRLSRKKLAPNAKRAILLQPAKIA